MYYVRLVSRASMTICGLSVVSLSGAMVKITNMTNRTIYAAVICTELKSVHRYLDLYDKVDAPHGLDKVKTIAPGDTVAVEVPIRAITQYDRNLWVTDIPGDFATIFSRKTRAGMHNVAAYTIGSSTAQRYIGMRDTMLKIFATKAEAERFTNQSRGAK